MTFRTEYILVSSGDIKATMDLISFRVVTRPLLFFSEICSKKLFMSLWSRASSVVSARYEGRSRAMLERNSPLIKIKMTH